MDLIFVFVKVTSRTVPPFFEDTSRPELNGSFV